jgi:hypothetical protein
MLIEMAIIFPETHSFRQDLQLWSYLSTLPDLVIDSSGYETATEFYNLCRKTDIQGANTDFFNYTILVNHNLPIFTVNKDFICFKTRLPVNLYEVNLLLIIQTSFRE